MARRAFFSFHYKNDVWRANQVRNSWVTKDDKEAEGFVDAAEFEKVEKQGEQTIKNWINGQLKGTSVTVVLIGPETNNRPYVKYEIEKSHETGNGMLGIYVHQLKDQDGKTSNKGSNQFGEIGKDSKGNPIYFSAEYPCYDWASDNGYKNMGGWIEAAAKKAGK
jgi:hypothetical protein